MQPVLDMRRHADGSIDFDFYRRRAARQRRLSQRVLMLLWVTYLSNMANAFLAFATRTAHHLWSRAHAPHNLPRKASASGPNF
jgi:hypothetical protein